MKATLALASIAVLVLSARDAHAETVGEPACVSDAGYARAYAELRARWVRFGGIGTGSGGLDARVRIDAAAVLVRRAPALAAHARMKRAAIARLRAWTTAEIDGESSLAFYLRALVSQAETETSRIEWLARAATDAATKARIADGARLVEAFNRAHPETEPAAPEHLVEARWGAIPWAERAKLIEVSDDIVRRLGFEGRDVFDGLALEFVSNGPHLPFLPWMTWFGAGVPADPCPPAIDGLLRALISLGLDGNYDVMLSGRTLSELARFSRRVREIKTEFHELSCVRPLPPPRVRYRAEARRIEVDAFSRPASCGAHLIGRHFSMRGEAHENAVPTPEQLRRAADQLLAAP